MYDSTSSGTKLDTLYIERDTLTSLIKKLKLNAPKAKLTGLLTVLMSHSYRQACIKHKINDIPLDCIQFDNLVSMRNKFAIENSQMGVFSHCLECRVDCEQLDASEKVFWSLAERESVSFHGRIAKNEEFAVYETEPIEAMRQINTNFDFSSHTHTNFMFSNIGVMSNTKPASPLRIVEHYPFIPCLASRVGPFLFFGVTTVDSKLLIAVSYNEKCFSGRFITDLKEEFLKQIHILSI